MQLDSKPRTPRSALSATLVTLFAGCCLLLTACGGGGSDSGATGGTGSSGGTDGTSSSGGGTGGTGGTGGSGSSSGPDGTIGNGGAGSTGGTGGSGSGGTGVEGSGNGGGGVVPDTTVVTSGTAAMGAPIIGGKVVLKCASGANASATTSLDGAWNVSLKPADYPCAVRVSGGTANGTAIASPLHSVVLASGTTNVTPLTDLIAAIVGGQSPATWYDNARSSDLGAAISATGLSTALDKLKTALATLPGKPAIPSGFNPLTSKFSAQKGDAGDDLLETFGSALQTAGLTQTDAAAHTATGHALTRKAVSLSVHTIPNSTSAFGFRGVATANLDGTTVLSIPDPKRGAFTVKAQSVDAEGNITALVAGSTVTGSVSLLGNRIGQLCTAGAGAFSKTQHSQYVYASDELSEVTDPSVLKGITFDDYEDCKKTGTFVINASGEGIYTETGETPDTPDTNFMAAFTSQGLEQTENGVTTVTRTKAYQYTAGGKTRYVYLGVSNVKDSTSSDFNDSTYVTMGLSQ